MIETQKIINFIDKQAYNITENKIKGVCSLNRMKPNCLLFYNSNDELVLSENEKTILKSCLVLVKNIELLPENTPCIITANPRLAFVKIVNKFFKEKLQPGIHPTAIIDKSVKIPANIKVGAYTVIEKNVKIGENTIIDNHITIKSGTRIGKYVHIKNGAILGDEGFGFEFDTNNVPIRMVHFGGLFIGDYVEIGNNCVINKGTIDDTIIEEHVKINDFSKIAHNVFIGKNSLIIGAKINGSVFIGENCWIAPAVTIQNKVKIGNGTMIGTGSVVVGNIPDNVIAFGNPAKVIREK
ncbi:MAG: hypothetical protein JXR50_11305 [Prolixibacteraceae bacterium]|nr:hypothetical protein [Prolixibacteraceae bacterium]MBN2650315.1 hypothetical protein [Prolixibacteraceae bacterium]